MGIAGLLPALRSIQKTKHLSEFKGQTIAVDAYVWLHKGVYACATELAIGKPTHKYVDYAMHRVRLLRHFGVEPYVVFDGGPLPAKRGTESERKRRREENLARGKALVAQGRHSQARDCFVKCIDVTPEMAYQFIKALRPENVKYVVAPYEADAQLAYLERRGLVSAILTEDSDLLVFGCKNVLFKLDHVANTVCHISRIDFGSVTSTALDSCSINLHGWNDTQFRAMAILSGCDYLPSIPGIGLKTANNLLRKWKTGEAVIRAVTLEGKKNVPNGYLQQYNLADKCFRFQRIYDPLEGKLVHLNDVEGEWDEEVDIYVGEDIAPALAKGIAMGDVDPINHLPMKDINPSFKPRAFMKSTKPPTVFDSSGRKDKGKEKIGGLLDFFGPALAIPKEKTRTFKADARPVLTGTSSGKRKLSEIMDQDLVNRQQRHARQSSGVVQSRFFSVSTPALHSPGNKENICGNIDDDEVEILSDLSLKANVSPTQDVDSDFLEDAVQQEEGYLSPLASYSPQIDELSSPHVRIFTPLKKKKRKSSPRGSNVALEVANDGERSDDEDDFDADPVSSPISTIKKKRRGSYSPTAIKHASHDGLHLRTSTRSFSMGNVLVADTPAQGHRNLRTGEPGAFLRGTSNKIYKGPDLRSCLGVGDEEEIATISSKSRSSTDELASGSRGEGGLRLGLKLGSVPPQPPLPQTPADGPAVPATIVTEDGASDIWKSLEERGVIDVDALDMEVEVETELEIDDPEDKAAKIQAETIKSVARAWRMKWAMKQFEEDDSSSSSASITSRAVRSKTKKSHSEKKRRQSAPMGPLASKLRRNETNVTPLGKHSLAHTGTNRSKQEQMLSWSVPLKARPMFRDSDADADVSEGRNGQSGDVRRQRQQLEKSSSLVFFTQNDTSLSSTQGKTTTTGGKPNFRDDTGLDTEDFGGSLNIEEISEETWLSLNRFKCVAASKRVVEA